MDFNLTEEQKMIASSAKEIAEAFGPEYWRQKEEKGEFGDEFWKAIGDAGFVGIAIPEEYGGSGRGTTELLTAMEELAANGCGMAGVWYLILTEVFGGLSIVRHGAEEHKRKYLPGIAKGELEFCMALTEPDAGSNTLNTKTTAKKQGNEWVIEGNKTFISGADRAKGMMIVARTTPKEKVTKKTLGLSLFLTDLPHELVEVKPIPKHGINYSHSCQVSFNGLRLPENALMPPQDLGWYSVLDTLNPERMSFTAAAVGIARLAINKAVDYSKQRKVFGDVPIGSYQGLQFPLAEAYATLEAARLLNFKAASLFDNGADAASVGAAVNMSSVAAVENATKAVYWAMQVFGGYGYAKEYDIERWWREINLIRLAPLTHQMALNYIGEHVLGMPRAYY
ncbi:MAG TPA: acyl-CoA/acyl-ACP dehydrogenase [Dehalococcoidia bacterium]|nr:acyl-CoA/acyl-ACP dehydrogenase [Dehalococcoidia bacterium]